MTIAISMNPKHKIRTLDLAGIKSGSVEKLCRRERELGELFLVRSLA